MTTKQAQDEVHELMTEHVTNTDRMNTFLHMLSETNEHMKPQHKKELIKVYSQAAEIFEEALLAFLPKILGYLEKRLKEPEMHLALAETFGSLVNHLLSKVEVLEQLLASFNPVLKLLFAALASPTKHL